MTDNRGWNRWIPVDTILSVACWLTAAFVVGIVWMEMWGWLTR